MDLKQLRAEIDKIDDEMFRLLSERMDISAKVAEYKRENGVPVHDPLREREILDKLSHKVSDDHKDAITALYKQLFELSRAIQK